MLAQKWCHTYVTNSYRQKSSTRWKKRLSIILSKYPNVTGIRWCSVAPNLQSGESILTTRRGRMSGWRVMGHAYLSVGRMNRSALIYGQDQQIQRVSLLLTGVRSSTCKTWPILTHFDPSAHVCEFPPLGPWEHPFFKLPLFFLLVGQTTAGRLFNRGPNALELMRKRTLYFFQHCGKLFFYVFKPCKNLSTVVKNVQN